MANESGGGPSVDLSGIAAFLDELLHGSPHPNLGPNDPPEWRRERARGQVQDWASRLAYGKSAGELTQADLLVGLINIFTQLPMMGGFSPAARGARGAAEMMARAAREGDLPALARSLRSFLVDPMPPTMAKPSGGYRYGVIPTGELALYGKRPVLRTQSLEALVTGLIEGALAPPPDAPPGSINPAVMP